MGTIVPIWEQLRVYAALSPVNRPIAARSYRCYEILGLDEDKLSALTLLLEISKFPPDSFLKILRYLAPGAISRAVA